MILGARHDYTCVSSLARQHANLLHAPVKGSHLFEHSANTPRVLEETSSPTASFSTVL